MGAALHSGQAQWAGRLYLSTEPAGSCTGFTSEHSNFRNFGPGTDVGDSKSKHRLRALVWFGTKLVRLRLVPGTDVGDSKSKHRLES